MAAVPRSRREVAQLIVGLALAIVFDTVQQLAWKIGVVSIPGTASFQARVEAALREPLFGLVAVLMLLRLINWLQVLKLADLSYALPITSLSYITVAAASAWYLGERLTMLQIVGMAIIVAGVWCVSQTERKSVAGGASTP